MTTLTLTTEQAELLGYVLTEAKRREDARAARIEELRRLLDEAPETRKREG